MNKARKIITILVCCTLPLAGCTSMQTVDHTGKPLQETLKPGQHVVVYDKSGRTLDMRYVLIADGELRGSLIDDGLASVSVPLADIERIEAEKIAVGRTAGAVAGGIVLLPIAALGVGLAVAEEMQ